VIARSRRTGVDQRVFSPGLKRIASSEHARELRGQTIDEISRGVIRGAEGRHSPRGTRGNCQVATGALAGTTIWRDDEVLLFDGAVA
jgi:hypothetical protein